MENGRCYMHGGAVPRGPALPQFKHGRYSKYLPKRIAERYEASAADSELLALREDIALVDARLADLLKRVDSGESGELWKRLRAAWKSYIATQAGGDELEVAAARQEVDNLIMHGLMDHAAWSEISALLEQRRRLVESERKRLVDMQQMITTEQAMLFMRAVVGVVQKHVHDRRTLAKISGELVQLAAQ